MKITFALLLLASPVAAQPISETASSLYPQMPAVTLVDHIAGNCGASPAVNPRIAYCTSQNRIFMAQAIVDQPSSDYELAHQFGHAIFVQHGLADVALDAIRANRDQEAYLRGQVTRQIECLAGVIYAQSGKPFASLTEWFSAEPFAGVHWGRDPLRVGPSASIGLEVRDEWFQKGQVRAHPVACEVPELPIELLLKPYRG